MSRDLAERTCVAMGGTLISFLYASTWFALVARLPRSPAASWWTSGVCDPTSDNCKWMSLDGTSKKYSVSDSVVFLFDALYMFSL